MTSATRNTHLEPVSPDNAVLLFVDQQEGLFSQIQRVRVVLGPHQRPQEAGLGRKADRADTRADGDGPVGADEGEPPRIGLELVKGVLLAEVVTAGIQRQAEVVGELAGPPVDLCGRPGGGEAEL